MCGRSEITKNVALAVGSIIVFLVLAEGLCRLLPDAITPSPLDPQNFQADRAAEPDDLLGYRLRRGIEVSGFRYNSHGFVGPEFDAAKPPGTYRIICLGGSTTLGTGADSDAFSYPALLQAIFTRTALPGSQPIQVLNAGVFGYHSWHTLLRVREHMRQYSPDMLLIMDGLNDLAAAKALTLTQINQFDADGKGPLSALAAQPTLAVRADKVLSKLSLYRLLKRTVGVHRAPAAQTGYGLDRIEEKFNRFGYSRNIVSAATYAADAGIQVALVDYPWKVRPGMGDADAAAMGMHPEHAALYAVGRRELPKANADISQGLNLPLAMPQPIFDSQDTSRQSIRRVWADDIHLTRFGNYLLAKSVYRSLMSLPRFQALTGRNAPLTDQELDPLFTNLLSWRPSDGQGWPSPGRHASPARILARENVKDGPRDEGSGFQAWIPADPSRPAKIVLELPTGSALGGTALYARISGGGDTVEVRSGEQNAFRLANDTGDGLWSPMAGWYGLPPVERGTLEIVLRGENAQIWHRGEAILFLPQTP